MMREIILGGETYGMRCDMNVVEAIYAEYGSLEDMPEKLSIGDVKFLVSEMINEHAAFSGSQVRVTPEKVGALLDVPEYVEAMRIVTACISDCCTPKKK